MENGEDIRKFIETMNKSHTFASMLTKILAVVRNENSPPQDLYNLVSHDQGFAERVVRMANSAMFGHSGQVRDIRHAIIFLGYERIKSIAIGMAVLNVFKDDKSFDVHNLWMHGYEVAYISAAISDTISMSQASESFLCGLIHDMGRAIFYKKDPKKFFEIGTDDNMFEKERELFGCTHAEAGGWYAEYAGMPEDVILSIRYHHQPSRATGNKTGVSVTALAEALSRRFSPKIEDDGIWTQEHDAIMLEFNFNEEHIISIGQRLGSLRHEIDNFFK
ncbi:MAG: HDOD domain-containing protein [Nitrospirae bacterium]|nr:HDOD domain-containing protein [Nitrospirota bacterium]